MEGNDKEGSRQKARHSARLCLQLERLLDKVKKKNRALIEPS
jgi:hypothetical protein